jgi:hypothetical protein
MHVVHKGRIVDLADLKEGSVFLADFDGGPIVRAVKAFYLNPSGIRAGKIVTVGPFREEDGGNPGVYEPQHITFKLPPSRECPGLVVLVGDDVYLGCQFHEDAGLWETAYLNVATGEIVFQVDAANGCVSRQWAFEARA